MTLGLYEERARRKQRFRWSIFKWLLGLGLIVGAGAFAYESGSGLAQREIDGLSLRLAEYEAAVDQLQRESAQLRYALEQANSQIAEQQARYEHDVPQGEIAELLALSRDKLETGVTLERLRFLIGAASNQRDCEAAPETKRFIVKTPLYTGANDWVGFADSTITVTAVGQSAVNSDGKAEAWFDAAEPVTLSFTHIGGKTAQKTGLLPLQHAFVIGDREHRFQVVASETRGFITVSGDSCSFP